MLPPYFGAHITNWAVGFPITTGITGRAIRDGKFIRTGNISQEPDYIAVESGMQSELCVPIQVHENIIGVVNVESQKAEAFDEKDERLLITIAGGLGTAIERIRLFKAQDTQLQREAALLKLMRAAASSLDLKQVLQIILDQLVMLIPAQAGSIQLLDKDHLNIVAVLGTESEQISKLGRISLSDFPVNQFVITEKHPLRIDDVRLDKHFINLTEHRRTKSFLAIPLIVKDQAIGLITQRGDPKGKMEA